MENSHTCFFLVCILIFLGVGWERGPFMIFFGFMENDKPIEKLQISEGVALGGGLGSLLNAYSMYKMY